MRLKEQLSNIDKKRGKKGRKEKGREEGDECSNENGIPRERVGPSHPSCCEGKNHFRKVEEKMKKRGEEKKEREEGRSKEVCRSKFPLALDARLPLLLGEKKKKKRKKRGERRGREWYAGVAGFQRTPIFSTCESCLAFPRGRKKKKEKKERKGGKTKKPCCFFNVPRIAGRKKKKERKRGGEGGGKTFATRNACFPFSPFSTPAPGDR